MKSKQGMNKNDLPLQVQSNNHRLAIHHPVLRGNLSFWAREKEFRYAVLTPVSRPFSGFPWVIRDPRQTGPEDREDPPRERDSARKRISAIKNKSTLIIPNISDRKLATTY